MKLKAATKNKEAQSLITLETPMKPPQRTLDTPPETPLKPLLQYLETLIILTDFLQANKLLLF